MKPRISKVGLRWLCEGQGIIGSGPTPSTAYLHWLRQFYELEIRQARKTISTKWQDVFPLPALGPFDRRF